MKVAKISKQRCEVQLQFPISLGSNYVIFTEVILVKIKHWSVIQIKKICRGKGAFSWHYLFKHILFRWWIVAAGDVLSLSQIKGKLEGKLSFTPAHLSTHLSFLCSFAFGSDADVDPALACRAYMKTFLLACVPCALQYNFLLMDWTSWSVSKTGGCVISVWPSF